MIISIPFLFATSSSAGGEIHEFWDDDMVFLLTGGFHAACKLSKTSLNAGVLGVLGTGGLARFKIFELKIVSATNGHSTVNLLQANEMPGYTGVQSSGDRGQSCLNDISVLMEHTAGRISKFN